MIDVVLAAGGLVHRDLDGRQEVLVIHRPRYGDWSFPKGKLDPGESFEQAALREVHEETGVSGVLEIELPEVRYTDHRGRSKRVRYWTMAVASIEEFVPDDEVDAIAWVGLDEARRMLTYGRDIELLDGLCDR